MTVTTFKKKKTKGMAYYPRLYLKAEKIKYRNGVSRKWQ
jgi:hypothetical protein